jgi:hypothetical protein
MAEKKKDGSLKRLREYMAEEAERLCQCGGRIHHIDLDEVDDENACLIPAPKIDPLERDVDVLFRESGRRRPDKTDSRLQ